MKSCLICKNKRFDKIFNFGHQPWCGDFYDYNNRKKIKYYPLNLVLCKKCKLLQLDYFVDKKKMFSDNLYTTGTSKELVQHFKKISYYIKKKIYI